MRILIAEDDPAIVSFLVKGLRADGHTTTVASTGDDTQRLLATTTDTFDLVLRDVGLSNLFGLDVLRRLREHGASLSVIILTARADVGDKVQGFELGANDHVTTPFSFAELLARIRATLRRSTQPVSNQLVTQDLRLDLLTKIAWREHRMDSTPREWALLELFMRHPTHVFSYSRILNEVWDYDFDPVNSIVDVYVRYLEGRPTSKILQR